MLYTTQYKTTIAKVLILSLILYGVHGVSDSKLNKIFTVQKRCIRVLFGDRES